MEGAARSGRDGVGDLLREAAARSARGERFVLATVVRRTAPSSARPGQKALVLPDGSLRGWLGGACIEPTIRREALEALRRGRARLVIFAPGGPEARPDAVGRADTAVYPMTCHSGGTVEIFVEPELPRPVLALFGDSPVNRALASMAPVAGFAVREVGTDAAHANFRAAEDATAEAAALDAHPEPRESRSRPDGPALVAVVATMGEWDEDAAEAALEAGAEYVGVVSSPRRATELRRLLADRGVDPGDLDRLVSPAGLDLGAESPGEIAVTILAELVERRRRGTAVGKVGAGARAGATGRGAGSVNAGPAPEGTPEDEADGDPAVRADAAGPGMAVDPVCGMEVEVEQARHRREHEGTLYVFCCPRCLERFTADPQAYV